MMLINLFYACTLLDMFLMNVLEILNNGNAKHGINRCGAKIE
jgi:hypothetical protein